MESVCLTTSSAAARQEWESAHPALPAVSQDELGPKLHLLLSSFFHWLEPAHSSMQYIDQVTPGRNRPMQLKASRRKSREVRRVAEEEGEIKVCHVIIKCLVCTMVLHVSQSSAELVRDTCGRRSYSP